MDSGSTLVVTDVTKGSYSEPSPLRRKETLKMVERLSGGSKGITERLYGLKILGDRVGALLDCCELEVNLHDLSMGLRREHGEERVLER
jgi:hypothetical protein